MSFVAAATAIGFTGVGATIAAGAMMGGATTVAGNVIGGRDPFDNIGRGLITGGITGGIAPSVASTFDLSMPMAAGITQGGLTALATGDIGQGLMAGATAYGMYGLTNAGQQMGLAEALSGTTTGGEQVFGDISAADASLPSDGSAGQAFNKYLTNPTATGAATQANATGNFLKDNFKYLAAAAAPILADQAVKSKGPQTVTQPGMIRPYSYDPYGGTYTAGTPYEVAPAKAADGGLMGMNDGGYSPGQLNFAERSEPVVRMAEGGIPGYAGNQGSLVNDAQIFDYFKGLDQSKVNSGALDAQIAKDMQTYNVSAADIARATGTQANQGNFETRFVNAINPATLSPTEFLARTADVGLTGQNLATALQNSGLSQAAQYSLTHDLNDITGIGTAPKLTQDLYNAFGYKAGNLKGDVGGLAGMYTNINQVANSLQDQINSGNLTVKDAVRLSDAEMKRLGISNADIKAATGRDFINLFLPKTVTKIDDKTTVTGGGGNDVITDTSVIPGGFYGNVTNPGDITTNRDGTVTVAPNIPYRPDGGFPGMESVRNAYTAGGGSLGYISPTYTKAQFKELYEDKLTGGSKQSYDYLTGKTPYDPTPFTKTGEIMKPYFESVGRFPAQDKNKNKKYLFKNGKYELNPDYVEPSYVQERKKAEADKKAETDKKTTGTTDVTNQDKKPTSDPGPGNEWVWDYAGKKWIASEIQKSAAGGLMAMARGGMSQQFDLGGYSDGGRLLRGPGDGVSDSIPATIGNKRPARLADGEFVVPARIVSELGNGSTEAGARKLYAMMDRVQKARRSTVGKGRVAKNSRSDKYLPA